METEGGARGRESFSTAATARSGLVAAPLRKIREGMYFDAAATSDDATSCRPRQAVQFASS